MKFERNKAKIFAKSQFSKRNSKPFLLISPLAHVRIHITLRLHSCTDIVHFFSRDVAVLLLITRFSSLTLILPLSNANNSAV